MNARVRAFTLLELLVAVAITLAMSGLMLAITVNVLGQWRRSQGGQAQAVAAMQVLDLIEQDLQAALQRSDGRCWLAAEVIDSPAGLANHGWLFGPGLLKPANGGSLRLLAQPDANAESRLCEGRFGLSGVWLRFVTTNGESGGSLPVVVSWQLVRRPVTGDPVSSNPAPVRYSLYRAVISPTETFTHGYDVTAVAYGSTSNIPSGATSGAYRAARNVTNPSHANVLAANVVDFGCWLYARDSAGGLQRIYPSAAADLTHRVSGGSMTSVSRFPEVADIMVRILSEEGAARIEAIESGHVARPPAYATDADWWWAVVELHSVVFIRRVEIKGVSP